MSLWHLYPVTFEIEDHPATSNEVWCSTVPEAAQSWGRTELEL
jgi:hypothetical protein